MLIHTRDFPGWFVWFGWLMVLPGPLSFPFPPAGFIYLQLTIVWAAACTCGQSAPLGAPT